MIRLDVWLTLPTGESIKAGTMVTADPDPARGGKMEGQFRYTSEYLEHDKAFPLDPLNLKPLSPKNYDANRPDAGVHGVFEDSLPDDWGRKLMVRHFKLERDKQRVPHLLGLLENRGLGALSYVEDGSSRHEKTSVSSRHLEELILQVEKFEKDPHSMIDDEFSLLFQAGSSPGGARPKALVEDKNGSYIAKFASTKDQLDVVSLEAATMALGRNAGIATAETKLIHLGTRKCLLVKRFDMNDAGGRNHLISMHSLLKAGMYYYSSYREMAEVIKHVSSQPGDDLHKLYRQMIFNTMVGNTDDHLKNFNMLHDNTGWRLSPAFDLTPNVGFNQEHVLRIGLSTKPPDITTLIDEGKYFGIKRQQQATEIIDEIYDAVMGWLAVFRKCTVPNTDIAIIGKDISRRLARITHKEL